MQSKSFLAVFAASFVFHCIISGGEASVVEREKRDDNEWIVTTLIEQPYVTKKRHPATTNDDFEGYIPDVLKRIGEKLNQKYRIREVPDGRYGMLEQRGGWTGLIGELTAKKADMAAAPITKNEERANVVDFTIPFMTFGTVILLRKPANASVPEPKTVHDLLEQPNLRFGAVTQGSTHQLLRSSSDPDLARLQDKLEEVNKQDEGVSRVRSGKGKFAFVIEEKTANFWKRQEPCELTTIPVDKLDTRDYALALPKQSRHTEKVNKALQELKDSGELDELERKWWTGPCSAASEIFGTLTLTLAAALGAILHSIKF